MWNKQKDDLMPQQQPEPVRATTHDYTAPSAAPPTQTRPRETAPAPTAAIGASMYIKGEIRLREELMVDGDVEGRIESESLLTVGPNGKVRANIKAREVVIFGSVRGDVEVTDKIAIRGQGSLIGNIKSAGISIDDGAYFKGSVDILRSDPAVAKAAARAAEPAPAARAAEPAARTENKVSAAR
ncbi:MAG TPA: polymer-forming cytoskeletal protein [Bryobacteraceae bacterium]|nr:polymer-forming cytoskeletal protein [Bryobacteraceae bacterium]